ncbi:ADP-ribose pyrophosphatase YjhB (NUDIX family) [Symbiobacterium terraclitae]|uniref:ADP-ribose pyrophosphatase YjhB (NUDIX family) n=1 Tax=Symbiobacterium terraclitae TaxID=557451 RepID=A0ABS4JTL5_9FIRM|nr:NUDIX hydrolase [Symbiobacterium terraclitae]MBP2018868.1 ADP-ribose pyrophosphatase YjhB (NUDIX family) [Symbiobacterium terraclitae]
MGRAYAGYPMPSCHALIMDGQQVLLVLRANPPLRGYWGLPGGRVELGETVEQALLREVREETGLDVTIERYLGYRDAIDRDESGRVRYHYVVQYFLARPAGGALTPSDDAAEARWVPLAELSGLPVTDAVEWCLAWAGVRSCRDAG